MSHQLQTRDQRLSKHDEFAEGCVTIPNALIAYHSKILYNTYFMLETQLNGLGADKQTCEKLESITQRVFNAWLALDYRGEE